MAQSANNTTRGEQSNVYCLRAAEISCIKMGKNCRACEFGVKVSIASTLWRHLVVGAIAYHGNPYEGHVSCAELEHASIVVHDIGMRSEVTVFDVVSCVVQHDNPGLCIARLGEIRGWPNQRVSS